MIIITSASYISQDFGSEFGQIPPAFLPVGNRRLFNYQVASLPDAERRILTVPESYVVSYHDRDRLKSLGVEILQIPENLSLGESAVCAINLASIPPDGPLKILHGDTLIQDLPNHELDLVTLSEVDGAYNWAIWNESSDEILTQLDDHPATGVIKIANGYFAFSDCGLFVRSVIHARGNFIQGVNAYSREKALTPIFVERWLDFGHDHTFYRSKARMTTQRAFNSLHISPKTVRKSSSDKEKMQAEFFWFSSLPDALKIYSPQLIRQLDDSKPGYEIQYLYLPSLNELYVFGRLPRFVWRTIFQSCFTFLDACRKYPPHSPTTTDASEWFYGKTCRRMPEFQKASGIDMDKPWVINGVDTPSLNEVIIRTAEIIQKADNAISCIVHGDFCFSNILYDFRSQTIRVIDPRGQLPDGTVSLFGDQRYDIAKFAHSVCGLYDFIIAGYYEIRASGYRLEFRLPLSDETRDVQDLFLSMLKDRYGLDIRVLLAMQVQLFLSMLPMHADDPDRQKALLANALRIFIAMQSS